MAEVTARKWRPKQFKDFVGQEYITSSLKVALLQQKIAHGYLFCGPRGIGKTSAARVFAKAVNCTNLLPEGEPCLKCKSCEEINAGKSIDVIEIDGASHRGIEKMREIRENIQFLPSYSRYKIYIIDEVHMLTSEAFNAILKMLEEPPAHILFIFATTEIHKVKNTIRSRCQQFYFKRLNVSQIAKQLELILESYTILYEKEAIKLIATAADGSMRDSQSIVDQAIVYCDGKITTEKVKEILGISSGEEFLLFLEILKENNGREMETFVQNIYAKGIDIAFFVEQLVEQFRILILVHYNATEFIDLEDDYFTPLKSYAKFFSVEQLHQIIKLLLILYKDLKEADNELFLVQATFFTLLDYKSFIHLGTLVKKLEQMEKTLQSQGTQDIVLEYTQEKKIVPAHSMEGENFPIKSKSTEKTLQEETFIAPRMDEDVQSIFQSFVKECNNPKWQGMLADVRKVELNGKVFVLEFITLKFHDYFEGETPLKKELLEYIKKRNKQVENLDYYVEKVSLSLEDKISLLKEEFNGEDFN